jgi:hypothetical protein
MVVYAGKQRMYMAVHISSRASASWKVIFGIAALSCPKMEDEFWITLVSTAKDRCLR